MRKTLYIILFTLLAASNARAGGKIRYYFTQPVNNSVSKGENAVYLNDKMGDTIVALINRAKYTLDIAVYNYTSTFPGIAVAANAANARGVKVRWIYDSSSSNTGIPLLNSGVRRMASPPDAGDYSIMHNKFMIIDANSPLDTDPMVWTGSSNWNAQQFNSDYNNSVLIQDRALAQAYRAHFNMMWGDTGIAPNRATAKFGQFKTDLGAHHFTVDGIHIELYFSPADGTNDKILAAINTANTDMYFGMSTFTFNADASALVARNNAGVYVAGISDAGNTVYTPHSILSSGLGSAKYKVHTASGLYHNKMLIVDPSNSCSDPLVLTGSHNWTVSANTRNDENTIIIHDATAANIFYQSFYADFANLGGTLPSIPDCVSSVNEFTSDEDDVTIFPNPSSEDITVSGNSLPNSTVIVTDMSGRVITTTTAGNKTTYTVELPAVGVYTLRIINNKTVIVRTIQKL